MSITRHHNEWLSLIEVSGPFLSLVVLKDAFPQGLEAHDADHARRLRLAFEEWDDDQDGRKPNPSIHWAWIKFVLEQTLGFENLLAERQAIPQTLKSEIAEYGETLRPDWVVNDPVTKKPRLLVQTYPRSQALGKPVQNSRWKTSPDTRMMQLLHDTDIRLGLVTNGDQWMLVNAPKSETTGYASWYANLWFEEPLTLRAFRTLLSADSFFGVAEDQTIEALLDRSAADQQEVTDQLGYQVRKAVEVLIQALDRADQDHGRKLIDQVDEKLLYEAALTVMMRLVFLFCAEERELLLLGDDLYDKNFAVSTLREQLRAAADQYGEEILGLRYDAWVRLLTTFRAVYGGVKHDRFRLPAYGGSLFNPDRFPFLEGREPHTSWKDHEAVPLPVNNRTVLHLLEALQVLQVRFPGGGPAEARRLSFRSLDIEQIGHVYEGLLDHTAKRAAEPVLGLQGTREKEPEIPLAKLEQLKAKGEKELLKFLKDETGRSESALKKSLSAEIDGQHVGRFRTACQGDENLWKRIETFAGLVRLDTADYPVVITPGSIYVTAGMDRRSSGTHYTPRSLTEPIVQYTLEPLVYIGPAEGLPKEQWKLRAAKELLDLKICDMACGSGAFLVQTCRYMATRLLEAWDDVQRANPGIVQITPEGEPSTGQPGEMLIPNDPDERQTYALRIVAQRCLYGVDKNPLAAEMAKLSLWLLTLAKNKPFEFLDHAIRCGDSLVGIHDLDQLRKFNVDGKGEDNRLFLQFLGERIKDAIGLRRQITEMQANTVEDVEVQDRILREANEKIERLKCAADMLIGAEFLRWEQHELIEDELKDEEEQAADDGERREPSWLKAKKVTEHFRHAARTKAAIEVAVHFNHSDLETFKDECSAWLNGQTPFHWPLEFPEVMVERGGFDAFVGNPPFMRGTKIQTHFSEQYLRGLLYLQERMNGNADLCSHFYRRAFDLLTLNGYFGLLATNTIAQGDTRECGLEVIIDQGGTIYHATNSLKWPGVAAVVVSVVHVARSKWIGESMLDERCVPSIDAFLSAQDSIQSTPLSLAESWTTYHNGSFLNGTGFVLTKEEGVALLAHDTYDSIIRPYVGGKDSYTLADPSIPERYIIYFGKLHEKDARKWPLAFEIIRERVYPERRFHKTKQLRELWWQLKRPTPDLYSDCVGKNRVIAKTQVSSTYAFVFLPATFIFDQRLIVFPDDRASTLSVLQCSFHEMWAGRYSATLKSDMSYTPQDCFETFPFPRDTEAFHLSLQGIGEQYHSARHHIMLTRQEGLTRTYYHFHDKKDISTDIQKLRQLHVEMDNAVAAAYGWTDLDLGHDFHETKQGRRFTISEPARREVLARLLKLNHERYAEEVAQGLHDKGKKKATVKKSKPKKTEQGPTLF